jgi:DNA replication and repair protein RecF
MLMIKKIILTGFKNHPLGSYHFDLPVVGICGKNGIGKTNLLDSIYYCCFTKSYFHSNDGQNIGFGEPGFRLEGHFELKGQSEKLVCINRLGSKKELYLNDIPYEKLSQHIGRFCCVIIAPDDIELINGTGELRRKFIDVLICQLDGEYLLDLSAYNKILQQRNSLLRNEPRNGVGDPALLDILDEQLAHYGDRVYQKRQHYFNEIHPKIISHYTGIAAHETEIQLRYESNLHGTNMKQCLKINRHKDLMMQRTISGVHRDDLVFEWNKQPMKNIASQGQKKSLLFSLKLAEYEMLLEKTGNTPILLLDDVFEKLDSERMANLLEVVCKKHNGQVLITDTHSDRLSSIMNALNIEIQIIHL